jgi:hypothetical protein
MEIRRHGNGRTIRRFHFILEGNTEAGHDANFRSTKAGSSVNPGR